jgi:hypothetical protein
LFFAEQQGQLPALGPQRTGRSPAVNPFSAHRRSRTPASELVDFESASMRESRRGSRLRDHVAVQNPWMQLPDSPPFIAPDDSEVLGRLQSKLVGDYELKLDLLPQPWTGNVNTAEVLVLALNPGFREEDYADLQNRDYAEQWRLALSFQTRTPFYFLDPAFQHTGGYLWWHRRLRDLIDVVGLDAVAQKVMCVEHFPYKSVRYGSLGTILPSQRYSFWIVQEAIRAGKQIVVMRSERVWLQSVPEMREYPYIRLSNNRNPYFSRTQMTAEEFGRLCEALR